MARIASGVWIDGLVVADVIGEFIVVLVATIAGLRWQPQPSDREMARLAQIGASDEACLVLLVSAGTCLRTRGKDKLVAAIESGLRRMKMGAVFVVDMGTGNAPLDDTWKVAEAAAGGEPGMVHYVYLPDNNKRLGEYWLSEIWIPFMYKSGRIGRLFRQMMVVDLDSIDDGSRVMEVGTLNKLLMVADGNIEDHSGTVVLLPVKSSVPGWTGKWETNRLQREYYMRMMEVGVSGGLVSTLSPSENLNIVDRRTLEVLAPSDPTQLALAAIERRGKVQIAAPSELNEVAVKNTLYQFVGPHGLALRLESAEEYIFWFGGHVSHLSVLLRAYWRWPGCWWCYVWPPTGRHCPALGW
ncbi:serine/threonine kinase [Perkinsus sp. BL_2016]|nr:serine/threonine kinase [Perkinsus sp. BL_2016]